MSHTQRSLQLNVIHGNLANVEAPVYALGVFEEIAPKAALLTIDRRLGGELLELYRANRIDGGLGVVTSHPTHSEALKAEHIILAGMGRIDEARSRNLRQVGQNIVSQIADMGYDTITTVPLGLGSGHALERVVTYFIGGMIDAVHQRMTGKHISTINICDLDADNCVKLKQELQSYLKTANIDNLDCSVVASSVSIDPPVHAHQDAECEPPLLYLQVRMGEYIDPAADQIHTETTLMLEDETSASKTRVTKVPADRLRSIIDSFDGYADINYALGQELAQLLLDDTTMREFAEAQAKTEHPITLLHDHAASIVPWEAISLPGLQQPATRLAFSRRLVSARLPPQPEQALDDADTLRILLIVDPTEDLDGARREGERIEALITRHGAAQLTMLWQAEASRERLCRELESGSHDVIHYAGHAFFDPANPGRSGLICHDRDVLTGEDLRQLDAFPFLVFLNACESGRIRRGRDGRRSVDATPALRIERGTGLAQAFLRGGVRHFLGTYWPVDDAAADVFSSEFYHRLVGGETIGQAIMRARQLVWRIPSSDWADYIHYGDPTERMRKRFSPTVE